MYETTYHLASDVKDAAARFAAAGEGRYLAGGQTPHTHHEAAARGAV